MDREEREEVDVNFFKFGEGVDELELLPNATVASILKVIKQHEEDANPNKRMAECV
jgi:hypothetical protein